MIPGGKTRRWKTAYERIKHEQLLRLMEEALRDGEYGSALAFVRAFHWRRAAIAELEKERRIVAVPVIGRTYAEYLESENWQWQRKRCLQAAGYRCQLCGVENAPLHVHHNNYRNVQDEDMKDLICLCQPCHQLFHDNRKVTYGT